MSKKAFEQKLEMLEALRSGGSASAETLVQLKKALEDKNNFFVSRAAAIVAHLRAEVLIPDLIAAFDKHMRDPVKSDPQCWAKNAIVKALKDLDHRESTVYLRGLTHVQMEPVWGGRSDSAATLRGACALALVDCSLDDLVILTHLADRLADGEKQVRVDAALAITQFGRAEGALLLRLKALQGDPEPEVLAQCFVGIETLTPASAVKFVARFLESGDEVVQAEAAAALAQSRDAEGIKLLRDFWAGRVAHTVRVALLGALGASALPEAREFLMFVLQNGTSDLAEAAVRAMGSSRFRAELRERVKRAVEEKGPGQVMRAFEAYF